MEAWAVVAMAMVAVAMAPTAPFAVEGIIPVAATEKPLSPGLSWNPCSPLLWVNCVMEDL